MRVTVLSWLALLAWAMPASPAPKMTDCTGPLGEVVVRGHVSAGAGCDLTDTTVLGDVVVRPGGFLVIWPSPNPTSTTPITGTGTTMSKTSIGGSIVSSGAAWIWIRAGRIAGGVRLDQTAGPEGNGILVENATIGGTVVVSNGAAWLWVQDSRIGGGVSVLANRGAHPGGDLSFVVGLLRSAVQAHVVVQNNVASGSMRNGIAVAESTVAGNVTVTDNEAENGLDENVLLVYGNDVRGTLTVSRNRMVPVPGDAESALNSFIEVSDNVVRKALVCESNTPAPRLNGRAPNTAALKKGECAGL